MMLYDFTAQHFTIDVRINLCCCDGFMPEHTLDGTQIGPSFEQMCGERMAERMGADVFSDVCLHGKLFNQMENHDSGKRFSAPVAHKDEIFVSRLYFNAVAVGEIESEFVYGAW